MAGAHPVNFGFPFPPHIHGETTKPVDCYRSVNLKSQITQEIREVIFYENNNDGRLCNSCARPIARGELIGRDFYSNGYIYCASCCKPNPDAADSTSDLMIVRVTYQLKRKSARRPIGRDSYNAVFTKKTFESFCVEMSAAGYPIIEYIVLKAG